MSGDKVIAVSAWSLGEFGCPHCGYRSGSVNMSMGGSNIWHCGECGKTCVVLSDGIAKSSIGMGNGDEDTFYPELQPHPRNGIPKHGRKDERPETGGEFFGSRGIGMDLCPCFVCGTRDRDKQGHNYLHNISGFVRCKEAGERVVDMFLYRDRELSLEAYLDYRDHEPDRVQVKIGACEEHLPNLEKLDALVRLDGIVTAEKVAEARGFKKEAGP